MELDVNCTGGEILQPPNASGIEPAASAPNEHKFGLPFILNVPIRRRARQSALAETIVVAPARGRQKVVDANKKQETELSKEEKKRRRSCKHEGCDNYIVHKGLCCRHGVGPLNGRAHH
ncbi:unnamed protein product [Phytophthora fragariaefolia]|uniref:Unnamed protein product n=1 Tax=Phytophthora fragariaefolia TaxID=1490495 RepID=A0A9W6X1D6_9STRA|nr:unnamed protein product [Phytophthora fragariaefolia]